MANKNTPVNSRLFLRGETFFSFFRWGLRWLLMGMAMVLHASPQDFISPHKNIRARVALDSEGRLVWSLHRKGIAVVEPSPLGITVDGLDYGKGCLPGEAITSRIREVYPWRGGKSRATNDCLAVTLPVRSAGLHEDWRLEMRVFDDGFAWRYRIPGSGPRTVNGESTAWTLPAGSVAWFQTDKGAYEGDYHSQHPEAIPLQATNATQTRSTLLGPPVTVRLSEGYLLLTEARLFGYSGMQLRPTGTRRLLAAFDDDPNGFAIEGEIVSPWRVTIAVSDLNGLVNSDLIPSLCERPDPRLFPKGPWSDWIQPGRGLNTWAVFQNDGAQWSRQKWFIDHSAALGFEYMLVDAGWRTAKWGFLAGGGDPWERLRELCDYGASRKVGLIVWNAFPEGRDDGPGLTRPEARREFFERCRAAGVKGVKIDFFDSESKSIVDAQEDLLRRSAEQRLMIIFHGTHKPTGEVRTWPHQITQEGLREQEFSLFYGDRMPLAHYGALPFTRMAIGHSDFLPGYVRQKFLHNTTRTFQMALAVIATTSFINWPDHPEDYQRSPFVKFMRTVPLVWDETRVLPSSEIGRWVALARRSGENWHVAVINCDSTARNWRAPCDFLGRGGYTATFYTDDPSRPDGVSVQTSQRLNRRGTLSAGLPSGGGFIACIHRSQ